MFSMQYLVIRVVWILTCGVRARFHWFNAVICSSVSDDFTPVTVEEVDRLIGIVACKTYQLDPVPSWLCRCFCTSL